MVEICIYVFKNQYGNGFILCELLLRIMENLHLTQRHMQFPFHIFLLKTQAPFFSIKVNTTSKTVSQEREEEKAAHSSQMRIVFLHSIATYFKCCSYSYRKPKRINWKKKHWNLLESTYKHKHCNEVSRYFISVCSKGNTDESVKVKIYLWPNPLILNWGGWGRRIGTMSGPAWAWVNPCLKTQTRG